MPSATAVDSRQLMSEAKFYESYSRFNDDEQRYETWNEAVDRVITMHEKNYIESNNKLAPYLAEAKTAYQEKRVLGAQRALQFGGEQILKHQMKMYNCTSSYVDRAEFFGEIFYILLCGAGAGFSVQKHHVAKLPKIAERKKQAKVYKVEDSIEGWANAVDVLLSSYFVGGGKHPEFEGRRVFFDLSLIRPKGAMISGGFKAPGPDGLRLALDRIELLIQQLILTDNVDQLRPIHVYDIVMHLADAVLSGGVRRSATICLFSLDDEEMMKAKTGNWWIKHPQRARSNNSAVVVRDEVDREKFNSVFESIKQFGEPGFVFVDSTEHTTNPCVEIGMYPQFEGKSGWQGCNLTEINGGLCDTKENFFKACRAAAILGTLQAGYTDFKFLSDTTKKIFDREALLGCSITGWMNNPEILFDEKTLREGAKLILKVNKEVAKIIGINPAARATCVKPSGNASVILKTASGIHGEHSPIWLRHVTMNKESEVAQLIAKTNPAMVEESRGSTSGNDYMIAFPVVSPDGSIYKEDLIGVNLLEKVKLVQQNWVEYGTDKSLCVDDRVRHNVSNTVDVQDWDSVGEYVYNNRQHFAGISFMASFGDKAFDQAPFTSLIDADDIVKKYGTAGVLASGLVVDALDAFDTLWVATATAKGYGEELDQDSKETAMKRDWIRRFDNFADNYLGGSADKAEECLKDVYLLHKWKKIIKNFKPIDWKTELTEKAFTDIDTMGAAACQGGACEIDF
jgi:ribonucleoside-diphosphate reductase alpha chain